LPAQEVSWENLPTHLPNAQRDSSTLSLSDSHDTIFISIASYRDSELKYTVRDIFRQAQDPSRIFVGIVLQLFDTPEDLELYGIDQIYDASFFPSCPNYLELSQLFHTNIRVLRLDAAESRGPCLARSLAQTLWKDEKFYFQIDSHMRFRRSYDSYLLQIYSQCEEILLKQGNSHLFPVLSTYPQGYQLNDAIPLTDIRSTVLVCPPHQL
jgi:[Skp1-protein]-hydroxyproline N-acetylglucosaminyltransferase